MNDEAEIETFEYNPRALSFMRKNLTTELPPQFPLKLRGTQYRRSRQYLECYGFRLENEFPNNVALLTTGEVILCVEFREPEVPGDGYILTGLCFKDIKPLYEEPINSTVLGLHTVHTIQFLKKNYSSNLLVSKCFCFAHPKNIDVNPVPECLNSYLYKSSSEKFHEEATKWTHSEEGSSTMSSNKWDVYSLIIPGRHTL